MKIIKKIVRETGLVEEICEHGIGHPEKESMKKMNKKYGGGYEVHGCDGCCGK